MNTELDPHNEPILPDPTAPQSPSESAAIRDEDERKKRKKALVFFVLPATLALIFIGSTVSNGAVRTAVNDFIVENVPAIGTWLGLTHSSEKPGSTDPDDGNSGRPGGQGQGGPQSPSDPTGIPTLPGLGEDDETTPEPTPDEPSEETPSEDPSPGKETPAPTLPTAQPTTQPTTQPTAAPTEPGTENPGPEITPPAAKPTPEPLDMVIETTAKDGTTINLGSHTPVLDGGETSSPVAIKLTNKSATVTTTRFHAPKTLTGTQIPMTIRQGSTVLFSGTVKPGAQLLTLTVNPHSTLTVQLTQTMPDNNSYQGKTVSTPLLITHTQGTSK